VNEASRDASFFVAVRNLNSEINTPDISKISQHIPLTAHPIQ
jgi:hypothetical protein